MTNPLGKTLSATADLVANTKPLIVVEPASISVNQGQTVILSVEALGAKPLLYQWYFNGQSIPNAINSTLSLGSATPAIEGTYTVTINNNFGSVSSAPAVVILNTKGGTLFFVNRDIQSGINFPIFNMDGVTPLAGPTFLAQLWASNNRDALKPIGPAVPFRQGAGAGYWNPGSDIVRAIADVAPGDRAFAQVRVWETGKGTTFQQAIEGGSPVGLSDIVEITTGGVGDPPSFPTQIKDWKSFALFNGVPPTVVTQPIPVSATAGSTAKFSVVANGTAPLLYQWELNG